MESVGRTVHSEVSGGFWRTSYSFVLDPAGGGSYCAHSHLSVGGTVKDVVEPMTVHLSLVCRGNRQGEVLKGRGWGYKTLEEGSITKLQLLCQGLPELLIIVSYV